ncbi:Dual specificity tyrosine-phosphorylation-regulated kinase 2 [Orchesella cincta]|uniref:dual-specificity kinase n=1 Tax=Orchesella cincta TaxID=48709 RepID=A0A1D2M2L8_ORCCI|nr:Dual specificity tyrosine-phosphorylation-regulated kinase 2 [Orchesella cincta]
MAEGLSEKMDVSQEVEEAVEQPSPSEVESVKSGMTPQEAYEKYQFDLSSFETSEIFKYPEIYFVGENATKISGGRSLSDTSIFDTKRNNCSSFLRRDHKENRSVAIKVMKSQPRYHQQAKPEIEMLERLNKLSKAENIDVVQMYDHFEFRNHVCIVFELLSKSLRNIIDETREQGLPLHRVQEFAASIIKVLDALGRNKIMHGDLKTDNILLKQPGTSDIKLVDFGIAEYDREEQTELIQALHFRAPEVGARSGMTDQLALAMEVFGVPPPEFLKVCSRAKNFFKDGKPYVADFRSYAEYRGKAGSRNLSLVLKNCKDVHFQDFIRGCFTWDPKARLTPSQALVHPFLTNKLPNPDDTEESAFAPAAEDSQPDSPASRRTYEESRATNKRKRSGWKIDRV